MCIKSEVEEIFFKLAANDKVMRSKKISNDQELIQSDPTPCPQNQKENKVLNI